MEFSIYYIGAPVAFKTWWGHQYIVGKICSLWLEQGRECISMGAAGARTHRSLGHHLLHPTILRLLVLCAPTDFKAQSSLLQHRLFSCDFLLRLVHKYLHPWGILCALQTKLQKHQQKGTSKNRLCVPLVCTTKYSCTEFYLYIIWEILLWLRFNSTIRDGTQFYVTVFESYIESIVSSIGQYSLRHLKYLGTIHVLRNQVNFTF